MCIYMNKWFIHNPKKSFRIRSLTSISNVCFLFLAASHVLSSWQVLDMRTSVDGGDSLAEQGWNKFCLVVSCSAILISSKVNKYSKPNIHAKQHLVICVKMGVVLQLNHQDKDFWLVFFHFWEIHIPGLKTWKYRNLILVAYYRVSQKNVT